MRHHSENGYSWVYDIYKMKKKKTSKIQTNISLLSELLVLDGGVNCGLHPQGKSAMTDMMERI